MNKFSRTPASFCLFDGMGGDFYEELKQRFELFDKAVSRVVTEKSFQIKVRRVKRHLLLAVKKYQCGFPADAYSSFNRAMKLLKEDPFLVYQKCANFKDTCGMIQNDPLDLYRIVRVPDNRKYGKERVFHTPLSMRSKVPTCRYSIAGFPSLYLGTEVQLCWEEVRFDPYKEVGLTAKFKIDRRIDNGNIRVYELAVKPQDFLEQDGNREGKRRRVERFALMGNEIAAKYLLWYLLIMSCSFIRANKDDPFAPEYIIPQLLMQWLRKEGESAQQLVGIRYFSCASERASDLGFNYVFPCDGKKARPDFPYSDVLVKSFLMTKPYYLNNYANADSCQWEMRRDCKLTRVDGTVI